MLGANTDWRMARDYCEYHSSHFYCTREKDSESQRSLNGLVLDFSNVNSDVARIRGFRDFFHFGHGQCHSDFHETNVFVCSYEKFVV